MNFIIVLKIWLFYQNAFHSFDLLSQAKIIDILPSVDLCVDL